MNKQIIKRLLAFVLILVMILTIMPMSVLANPVSGAIVVTTERSTTVCVAHRARRGDCIAMVR